VIQSAAKLRSVVAVTVAFAWLLALAPAVARAQDKPPATPPAPAAPAPAQAAKSSKAAKTSKPKTPKPAKPPEPSMDERRKADGVYAKGSNWLQLRFGYAKRTGDLSGDGFVGYGMAYQRMLSKKYAFAAGVDHDVVGHFAKQIDESVPFTGEFRRVFKWAGEMRPYLGLGGGYYFRKMYRTGDDYNTTVTGGGHVSFGLASQLDDKHVIGFETRVAWLKGRKGITNPTFGPGEDVETIWTAKLTWALAY